MVPDLCPDKEPHALWKSWTKSLNLPAGIAALAQEVTNWGLEAGNYIGEVVNALIDGLFDGFHND